MPDLNTPRYTSADKILLLFIYIYCFEDLVESDLVKEDAGDSVEGVDCVDDDHKDEPEPHGQVHLLIDDVLQCQCQHVAIVG